MTFGCITTDWTAPCHAQANHCSTFTQHHGRLDLSIHIELYISNQLEAQPLCSSPNMSAPSDRSPTPCSAPQSKQEPMCKQQRIRDNQRRSRARRQEYLADLERRLRESHSTCRDAEVQRTALVDLQQENSCLRTLLNVTGVSKKLVDSFLRQHSAEVHSPSPGATPMRRLRPKIQLPEILSAAKETNGTSTPAQKYTMTKHVNETTFTAQSTPSTTPALQPFPSDFANYPALMNTVETEPTYASEDPDWQFDMPLFSSPNGNEHSDGFCCSIFKIPAQSPVDYDDRDSVQCSIAKTLLDEYNVPDLEMEVIKLRLSTGFSKPSSEGKGCRVNNQILFSVLNELSAQHG